jgi:hypothetical protein
MMNTSGAVSVALVVVAALPVDAAAAYEGWGPSLSFEEPVAIVVGGATLALASPAAGVVDTVAAVHDSRLPVAWGIAELTLGFRAVVATHNRAGTRSRRRKPVGVKAILATPLDRRTALPPQPWFEQRRRMICWADARAPETRAYLDRYWAFQRAFREASAALRAGQLTAPFPPWSFRPVCYCRPTAPPG